VTAGNGLDDVLVRAALDDAVDGRATALAQRRALARRKVKFVRGFQVKGSPVHAAGQHLAQPVPERGTADKRQVMTRMPPEATTLASLVFVVRVPVPAACLAAHVAARRSSARIEKMCFRPSG